MGGVVFFFNDPTTTEIYTLSLHDALPISHSESLKYRLHGSMARWEKARDVRVIHASDITREEFCPREFAFLDITGKAPKGQFVGTSLRATFDLGCALQNKLNQDWGKRWCIGTWVCDVCGQEHTFQHCPEKCDACGRTSFMYKEEQFISDEFGYSGSIDFIFDYAKIMKYRIVEVKTIVKDDFKDLKAPLAEHADRTKLYMHLVDGCDDPRSEMIDTDTAIILYICKGYGCLDKTLKDQHIADSPFTPFKEFFIKRDDKVLTGFLKKAKAINTFRAGGKIPEGECSTLFCKRAKICVVKKECWGVE